MQKVKVLAEAYDRETGKSKSKKARWETIDLKENTLFSSCKTILDVHDAYESFWNRLNDYSDLVFVKEIKIIK